jgi:hypothetical protein
MSNLNDEGEEVRIYQALARPKLFSLNQTSISAPIIGTKKIETTMDEFKDTLFLPDKQEYCFFIGSFIIFPR